MFDISPYLLGIVTIAFLTINIIVILKLYGTKAFLHPGFSFSLIFALTVLSSLLVDATNGNMRIVFPEIFNELLYLVIFTGACLTLFAFQGRKTIVNHFPQLELDNFKNAFIYLAPICYLFSIIKYYRRGGSFNFQEMRDRMVELETKVFDTGSQSSFDSLIGYFELFNQVIMIYSGWEIALLLLNRKDDFQRKWNTLLLRILMFIPILSSFIFSLSVGGRAVFISNIRFLFFGIILRLCSLKEINFKKMKHMFIYIFIVISLFSLYSNINLNQRYKAGGFSARSTLLDIPVINQFYSIIEYLNSANYGYQLRRMDYVTPELDYGQKSFGGIIFTRLPFSNILGINQSLGTYLGLEHKYTMKKMFLELEEENATHFSVIPTIFMTLYDDFGFIGSLIVIFFLSLISQYIFIRWFSSNHKGFLSFFFLLLVFWFWSNAIFNPIFASGDPNNIFIVLLLFDFIMILSPNKSNIQIQQEANS